MTDTILIEEDKLIKPLPEKLLFLFLDSTTSEVLVSKIDKRNPIGVDYLHDSQNRLTLKLSINKYLSFSQIPVNDLQLICVNDLIHLNTIYKIYLSTVKIDKSNIPEDLEYVKIKNLTNKSNPNSKMYLDTFLKIFGDLELIKILTKLR